MTLDVSVDDGQVKLVPTPESVDVRSRREVGRNLSP
jgi:hypothetical protein